MKYLLPRLVLAPAPFLSTLFCCPCADCEDVLPEGHDQQAVWPGGSRAEGGQAEAAGGADSGGRRRRQGENPGVRVSYKANWNTWNSYMVHAGQLMVRST